MRTQKLYFSNQHGEKLAANLDMPLDGKPLAYALFAHCFTCSKNLKAITYISRALAQQGIAVLRFDFTGIGESEGDFSQTNFTSNIADMISAGQFLEQQYQAPTILIGHSLGGSAALAAASRIPSCAAVVTIAAPYEPIHVTDHFSDRHQQIRREGQAQITVGGQPFTITRQFLDDLENFRMTDSIAGHGRALLIFHSPQDDTVGIDNASKIFATARHPKSFISLDGSDHLLSRAADARYVGATIAAWVAKYIDIGKQAGEAREQHKGEVRVRIGKDKYTTEIYAHNHSLLADEPIEEGGDDQGPNPYELLTAALGACTAITLRMYADHKNWPLDEVIVHLQHEKAHASDCQDCPEANIRIDHIDRRIELVGGLSDEQRQRLHEIADKCPVHKTLQEPLSVTTVLK